MLIRKDITLTRYRYDQSERTEVATALRHADCEFGNEIAAWITGRPFIKIKSNLIIEIGKSFLF